MRACAMVLVTFSRYRDGIADVTIPFDEIAALVIVHPQVSLTQAVVDSVVEHGGSLVVCDHRSLPIGMLLPLAGHHLTTRYAIETGDGVFRQTLFATLSIVVASLVGVLDGTQKELVLPHALA